MTDLELTAGRIVYQEMSSSARADLQRLVDAGQSPRQIERQLRNGRKLTAAQIAQVSLAAEYYQSTKQQ